MTIVQPTEENLRLAALRLREGCLVAFPTETVYGLGADATSGLAVAEIFAAKGRPRFNPLIVHLADATLVGDYATVTPLAQRLAAALWPGPLTLVLQKVPGCALTDLVSAGQDSVALRVPDHPVARAVLKETGRPLAAPSANRSGHVSPTLAQHVAADLGDRVATILDGGPTDYGLESTVIDARGETPVLLRPGAIPAEAIEAVLGMPLVRSAQDVNAPRSPGLLASHYAPQAGVRLNATSVAPGEALLAFGPNPLSTSGPAINLSESGDLSEAAARFFAALRWLDQSGAEMIAVMPIPTHGLGEAINDRLLRAAAPRTSEIARTEN
jgi:L-threonylcarbamoyladenylate synthase